MRESTVDAKDLVFRVSISEYAELMMGLDGRQPIYNGAATPAEWIEVFSTTHVMGNSVRLMARGRA